MKGTRILNIEWQKLRYSNSWWILLVLYIVVLFLALANLNALIKNADVMVQGLPQLDFSFNKIMRFPQIWHNLTYLAGFFKIIPAMIVITSVSQEFAHRTVRQNIIDGWSRGDFLTGKLFVVLLLTLVSVGFVFATGMVFGMSNSTAEEAAGCMVQANYLTAYVVEFFTYMCFALLLAVLVKRPAVALILLLVLDIMVEPFLGLFLGTPLKQYLPFTAVDDLIRFPLLHMIDETQESGVRIEKMVLSAAYGIAAFWLSVAYLRRTNL